MNPEPHARVQQFPVTCPKCGKTIRRGALVWYWPSVRRSYHKECGDRDYRTWLEKERDRFLATHPMPENSPRPKVFRRQKKSIANRKENTP